MCSYIRIKNTSSYPATTSQFQRRQREVGGEISNDIEFISSGWPWSLNAFQAEPSPLQPPGRNPANTEGMWGWQVDSPFPLSFTYMLYI